MVGWECLTKPREASGLDPEAVHTRGIEAVAEVDAYAGLLTSMHATGLRRVGYGVRSSIPDQSDDPPYESFVGEQEQFQREILADLQEGRATRFCPFRLVVRMAVDLFTRQPARVRQHAGILSVENAPKGWSASTLCYTAQGIKSIGMLHGKGISSSLADIVI